ncbi:PAS domain S-box protein [Chachezhania antarctica]|uniref:PAS domain S-box protein n=1 Tax=Chachezhania antarctica TaxID=2340860 RepID=UPI0013CE8C31|nr:PAS domain-containing protein [Chachezhania antarctica]
MSADDGENGSGGDQDLDGTTSDRHEDPRTPPDDEQQDLEWVLSVFDDIEAFLQTHRIQAAACEIAHVRRRLAPILRRPADAAGGTALQDGVDGLKQALRQANNRAADARDDLFALFMSGLPGVERLLFDHAPVMMHSFDREGRLVQVSSYWLDVMKQSRKHVIGTHSRHFMTLKSQDKAQALLPVLFENGRIDDVELDLVRSDGEVLPVTFSAALRHGMGRAEPTSIALTRI